MNADQEREFLDLLSEQVIGCAFEVSNALGSGFLEKVYENALASEIRETTDLRVEQQHPMAVSYKGRVVGEFVADLLVEDRLLVELKAVSALDKIHRAQCVNYLRATGLRLCLLLNFGLPRVEIARVVYRF
jgi:GxxExxY protein